MSGNAPSKEAYLFFERNDGVLQEFAKQHNLMVESFYRNQPVWRFMFRRWDGGIGHTDLHWEPGGNVFVTGNLHFDDFARLVRQIRSSAPIEISPKDVDSIMGALESTLAQLLLWPRDASFKTVSMPADLWPPHIRERLQSSMERLPTAKL